jgi:hypothetical protein
LKFLFYIKSFINNKFIYYLTTLFHVKVTMLCPSQFHSSGCTTYGCPLVHLPCRKGKECDSDSCTLSHYTRHEVEQSQYRQVRPKTFQKPCKFFRQGNCRNRQCQYLHIQPQGSMFCQAVASPVQNIDSSDFGNSMKGKPDACQTEEYCEIEKSEGYCSDYPECPFRHDCEMSDEENDTGSYYPNCHDVGKSIVIPLEGTREYRNASQTWYPECKDCEICKGNAFLCSKLEHQRIAINALPMTNGQN